MFWQNNVMQVAPEVMLAAEGLLCLSTLFHTCVQSSPFNEAAF
jgi:hypothetical protein